MIFTRKNCLLLLVTASFFVGAFQASASVATVLPGFGDLDRWGVFTLGNGPSPDWMKNDSLVDGDVGVAGNGDITMTDNARINGNLYYRSNGTLKMSGSATIIGARFHNMDSVLDNAAKQARAASNQAAALRPTSQLRDINLSGSQNITLTGGPGQTVVLSLKSFRMTANSTLTLQGTATTNFIINVGKQFSLAGNARIILTGGVQWNNVLFNVRSDNAGVQLSGNSVFQGILMANQATALIRDNATVNGSVIANKVFLRDHAHVIHPPTMSATPAP